MGLAVLSKMAAMYSGSKVFASLRSMLLKMKTASVERPVVVRMGGAAARARVVRAEDEAEGIDQEEALRCTR